MQGENRQKSGIEGFGRYGQPDELFLPSPSPNTSPHLTGCQLPASCSSKDLAAPAHVMLQFPFNREQDIAAQCENGNNV
jgi:hypothetical protein